MTQLQLVMNDHAVVVLVAVVAIMIAAIAIAVVIAVAALYQHMIDRSRFRKHHIDADNHLKYSDNNYCSLE